jgi:hypothetical protein
MNHHSVNHHITVPSPPTQYPVLVGLARLPRVSMYDYVEFRSGIAPLVSTRKSSKKSGLFVCTFILYSK